MQKKEEKEIQSTNIEFEKQGSICHVIQGIRYGNIVAKDRGFDTPWAPPPGLFFFLHVVRADLELY